MSTPKFPAKTRPIVTFPLMMVLETSKVRLPGLSQTTLLNTPVMLPEEKPTPMSFAVLTFPFELCEPAIIFPLPVPEKSDASTVTIVEKAYLAVEEVETLVESVFELPPAAVMDGCVPSSVVAVVVNVPSVPEMVMPVSYTHLTLPTICSV